ncbi:MAG TPA: hypothetical protein VGA10_05445, partial [Thermoanaerobaculia bacterium]
DIEKLPYEISKQIVDRHFVVELSTAPDTLIAHFEVEQGGLVADSIHTAWRTAPRPTSSSATNTASFAMRPSSNLCRSALTTPQSTL